MFCFSLYYSIIILIHSIKKGCWYWSEDSLEKTYDFS